MRNRQKLSGIYIIKSNIKPDRFYIGASKDITARWRCHINSLKYKTHHNKKLQRHFNKHGLADLSFKVIEECKAYDYLLSPKEKYYIQIYKPYFNETVNYLNINPVLF